MHSAMKAMSWSLLPSRTTVAAGVVPWSSLTGRPYPEKLTVARDPPQCSRANAAATSSVTFVPCKLRSRTALPVRPSTSTRPPVWPSSLLARSSQVTALLLSPSHSAVRPCVVRSVAASSRRLLSARPSAVSEGAEGSSLPKTMAPGTPSPLARRSSSDSRPSRSSASGIPQKSSIAARSSTARASVRAASSRIPLNPTSSDVRLLAMSPSTRLVTASAVKWAVCVAGGRGSAACPSNTPQSHERARLSDLTRQRGSASASLSTPERSAPLEVRLLLARLSEVMVGLLGRASASIAVMRGLSAATSSRLSCIVLLPNNMSTWRVALPARPRSTRAVCGSADASASAAPCLRPFPDKSRLVRRVAGSAEATVLHRASLLASSGQKTPWRLSVWREVQ
mmetsp:Transcript_14090/g.44631  ORF Transcript_14090/g.44631 Transcript_14090/m.44631 type:complete len:396 (-) Transcript_14090:615-1802(-)